MKHNIGVSSELSYVISLDLKAELFFKYLLLFHSNESEQT